MVNPGKPSTGCYTCRKRRIKCDERHPFCFRCEKSRRVCYGYRSDPDNVFRSDNAAAKKNAVVHQHATSLGTQTNCFTDLFVQSFFPVDPESLVMLHLFSHVEWKDNNLLLICRDQYKSSLPSSPIGPITAAFAWVNAPLHPYTVNSQDHARSHYTQAVVKLRKQLEAPAKISNNEMLLCMVMLALLEVALGDPPARDEGAGTPVGAAARFVEETRKMSHLKGAMTFIEASKDSGSDEIFHPPVLAALMTHLILSWIVAPLRHAMQIGAALKSFSISAGPILHLPSFVARLTQLGVTAAEIHTEVRLYRARHWIGVDEQKLSRLYAKCCRLASQLSKATPEHCADDPTASAAMEDATLALPESWDVPLHRDTSLWGRRDFSTVCLYRIIVCVAARRCIARMMDNVALDDPNAAYHILALEDADNRAQDLLSHVCEDIFDLIPHFFDDSRVTTPQSGVSDSDDPSIAFWGAQKPRIGAYLLAMPMRAIESIPDLPQATHERVMDIAHRLSERTGIDLQYILFRLKGNLFELDNPTS